MFDDTKELLRKSGQIRRCQYHNMFVDDMPMKLQPMQMIHLRNFDCVNKLECINVVVVIYKCTCVRRTNIQRPIITICFSIASTKIFYNICLDGQNSSRFYIATGWTNLIYMYGKQTQLCLKGIRLHYTISYTYMHA